MKHPPTNSPPRESLFRWSTARRTLVGLASFATLIAVFYAEEDWRGQRAWENCKREMAAQGETLDWKSYVPPAIPEEQNIFKAPKMSDWFERSGNSELSKHLSTETLTGFLHRSNPVIELKVLPPGTSVDTNAEDLLLRFEDSAWSLASPEDFAEPAPQSIPLIVFDGAPLTTALQALAQQAAINYILDPRVTAGWQEWGGPREPEVTIRWQNLSGREAFRALLRIHGMMLITDPRTGIGRVVPRGVAKSQVILTADARSELERCTLGAQSAREGSKPATELSTVRRIRFVAGTLPAQRAVRVLVLSDELPDATMVQELFPREIAPERSEIVTWKVEAGTKGVFRLFPWDVRVCSAQDHLAWSDRFAPQIEVIRTALQRPEARMDGDYERPFSIAIPNFVCIRQFAQMLAERAQCHLLLGQPDRALQELTLMHDLRKLLASKPALLVATMIDVAITGLYSEIIADGFRLGAWREPELARLQQQLAEVNLPPAVIAAVRTERAAICQTLLNLPAQEVVTAFQFLEQKPGFWERITNPAYLLIRFAPRGWVYQNLVTLARLEQPFALGLFDDKTQQVLPAKMPRDSDIQKQLASKSPFTVLARVAAPNFSRAIQVATRNQTKANQARVACALERYRIQHGDYPDSLSALVPQLLERLPHDIIGGGQLKYHRHDDGKFLLYSVGWNESDDGGQTTFRPDGSAQEDSPDWVWSLELP